jgi:uroporphyrinogen-III synthase
MGRSMTTPPPTGPPPTGPGQPPGSPGGLAGWRVLVTRPADQAAPLASALREQGAEPVLYPTIQVGPPPSWAAFDAAVLAEALSTYCFIVFTSPSAARLAIGRRGELAHDLAAPGAPAVAAVGAETARALIARGVAVKLVPEDQRQEGLVAAFASVPAGARILFPQAVGGRELLAEALVARGIVVDVVAVSQTLPLVLDTPPPPFDVATFASPSALRAFVAGRGAGARSLEGRTVAVIGPTTQAAARAAGIDVDVMPPTPSVAALVAALVRHRHHHRP